MKHGGDNLIYRKKEAHRREMIEIQKERIGLAKYITAMSLGMSTGIYIFIGATIGGVAENMVDDATLSDTLIAFLDANRLTVILICALASFLITVMTGIVVILHHIKNWGNANRPYNYRERLMIVFTFFGIAFILVYLLVISWDAAVVPIAVHGEIVFSSFLAICLLFAFGYVMITLVRTIVTVIRVVWAVAYGFVMIIRIMINAYRINSRFNPSGYKGSLIKLLMTLLSIASGK